MNAGSLESSSASHATQSSFFSGLQTSQVYDNLMKQCLRVSRLPVQIAMLFVFISFQILQQYIITCFEQLNLSLPANLIGAPNFCACLL